MSQVRWCSKESRLLPSLWTAEREAMRVTIQGPTPANLEVALTVQRFTHELDDNPGVYVTGEEQYNLLIDIITEVVGTNRGEAMLDSMTDAQIADECVAIERAALAWLKEHMTVEGNA